MSHISTVKTAITDLDAIEVACRELGLELRREQKTYRTYNKQKHACHAAIVVPGNERAYEIGLVLGQDGQTYEVKFDTWNGGKGMVEKAGEGCRKILVEYGRAKTKSIAQSKGWSYREERLQDGRIRCYCEPKRAKAYAGAKRSW
jgi:hypothetical protein